MRGAVRAIAPAKQLDARRHAAASEPTERRDDVLALGQRIGQSVIGQEAMVERLLLGLLADGHLLVEGLPGLAKTRAIKSLARNLDAELSRIQFTPDLLPSDITGSEIYFSEGGKGEFKFQQGPVFANLDPRRRDQPRARPRCSRRCSRRWRSAR